MAEYDPIGIAYVSDEYEPEATTILPRLAEAEEAVALAAILQEEFAHWFSPPIAGSIARYRPIAEAVWVLYMRWMLTPST